MSTQHKDFTYALIDGIFDTLYNNMTYGGVTYPVYKSTPKPAPSTYVIIDQINSIENGTKDYFIYEGTINIVICDDSAQRGDKKLAQGILGVVRGLLKSTRTSTFTVTGFTLVAFTPGVFNDFVEQSETGYSRIRLIDQYNFIIN